MKVQTPLRDYPPQFYYEVHLTVDPKDTETSYEMFAWTAADSGWKASKFEHDDVDNTVGKWFMSNRYEVSSEMLPSAQIYLIQQEIIGWVHGLSCNDMVVERWKIEQTLADSKLGHKLEDL
jgi:cellobiose phosphorylase